MSFTMPDAVEGILAGNYDPNVPLQPFIDTSDVMLTQVVSIAMGRNYAFDSATIEMIARWLSAHYYIVSDRTYAGRSTDSASGTFDGKTNMYLESSIYGQQAMRLDPTGILQAIGGQKLNRPKIKWAGRRWRDCR